MTKKANRIPIERRIAKVTAFLNGLGLLLDSVESVSNTEMSAFLTSVLLELVTELAVDFSVDSFWLKI